MAVEIEKSYAVREEDERGMALRVEKRETENLTWVSVDNGALRASIIPNHGGNHQFSFIVVDAEGRTNASYGSARIQVGFVQLPPR